MAAKVVSFINLKGGVGKTTLALAVGEFISFWGVGNKLLFIDMDAQYNLSYALLARSRLEDAWQQEKSMFHMFKAALDGQSWDIQPAIIEDCSNFGFSTNDKLHILVCSPELGQLDEEILDRWTQNKKAHADLRLVLKQHLNKVKDMYDWIIIDCPPSLSISTSNAILCSDYWVCPLIPEALSLLGIDRIQERIGELKQRYGDASVNIDFVGSILNRVDIRRGDHIRETENIYQHSASYSPFDCWVGDWKPLYIVSDYDYPAREYREGERSSPTWWNVEEKYGDRNRAQNNKSLLLQRKLHLGSSYLIRDVIGNLAKEFKRRCA